MRNYFLTTAFFFLFMGLLPFQACNTCKEEIIEQIIIDKLGTYIVEKINGGGYTATDTSTLYQYEDLVIQVGVSESHYITSTEEIPFIPSTLFTSEALAKKCTFAEPKQSDTIQSILVISNDTISFNSVTYLPGQELSAFFSLEGHTDATMNDYFSSNTVYLNTNHMLNLVLNTPPDNRVEGTFRLQVQYTNGWNYYSFSDKIKLE